MATIIVTGAAGFIGSHTVDLLLRSGHRVVGLDNFRTGRESNLHHSLSHPSFDLARADLTADGVLDALFERHRPEAIIHLAALVSVTESIENPALNYHLNVHATHLVAESARRHGVKNVVFASSAAVYGDARDLPVHEEAPKAPISPYGAAKLASEALLLGHARSFGVTAVCLRYFNVYGPRQDPRSPYAGVISIFREKFSAGLAPVIFGDGEQTRDFISVRDVAAANLAAALTPGPLTGPVNVCSGRETSLNELSAALARHCHTDRQPSKQPARPGDIRHSCGSTLRAQRELGFSARIAIEDGLASFVREASVA